LSRRLTNYHAMKTYGEWRYFPRTALGGNELSDSCSSCFTPGERVPGTYCTGLAVNLRFLS